MSTLNVNSIVDEPGTGSPDFPNGASVNSNPLPTAGSLSNRNKIINGNFGINQRAVSGTVTLSAGDYGHDRWKAGSSGCTYTFATSANVTTITISAGSLVQVIEGLNLQSGTHVLSWTGTVQMKIDGGSAGNSGMTGTLTGGTNATVETSGTGTLSLVQLEAGDTATPFEHRSYGQELALCQRYFTNWVGDSSGTGFRAIGSGYVSVTNTDASIVIPLSVAMRTTPTVAFSGTIWLIDGTVSPTVSSILLSYSASNQSMWVVLRGGLAMTTGRSVLAYTNNASTSFLSLSAEL